MTSYSTFATGRINLVDGDLTPSDDERAEEDRAAICQALTAGAIRALLDTANDISDDEAEVEATDWHSADEGWEQDAVTDADLPILEKLVEEFVSDNQTNVIGLAQRIAWDRRYASETFAGDQGMGFYRVGMLLGYRLRRAGIGFEDYSTPIRIQPDGPWMKDTVVDALNRWVEAHEDGRFEDAYIDSTEQPCLLHISSY